MSALLDPPAEHIADQRPSPLIGIADYGMGNLRSVEKALEHVGARTLRTSDADALAGCDGLVLPGVGAFPRAMANLRERGLDSFVRETVASGKPTLGICLGMQLAFERSEELGGAEGLGLLSGEIRRLDPGDDRPLPHIGWNAARFELASALRAGLPDVVDFYHVHSFVAHPTDPADVLATAEYGERFATAVERGNFAGVQFHPEKSSTLGLRLLANFATVCAGVR